MIAPSFILCSWLVFTLVRLSCTWVHLYIYTLQSSRWRCASSWFINITIKEEDNPHALYGSYFEKTRWKEWPSRVPYFFISYGCVIQRHVLHLHRDFFMCWLHTEVLEEAGVLMMLRSKCWSKHDSPTLAHTDNKWKSVIILHFTTTESANVEGLNQKCSLRLIIFTC